MTSTQLERIRAVVSGRVQGVSYRANTQRQARRIGVTGWVRNLDDGTVEYEAQGTAEQLRQLLAWAQRGPELARVDSVQHEPRPPLEHEQGFLIR